VCGELGQLKPVGVCLPVSIFISANRLCCVGAGMWPQSSRFSDVPAENQFWPNSVVLAPPLDPLTMPPCTMRAGHGGVPFFECMTQIALAGVPRQGCQVFIREEISLMMGEGLWALVSDVTRCSEVSTWCWFSEGECVRFVDLAKIQVDLVSRSCVIELCYFVDLGVNVVVFFASIDVQ